MSTQTASKKSGWDPRLVLLAAAPVVLFVTGAYLVGQAGLVDVGACIDRSKDTHLLPDYWLLAGSVLAVLVGRVLGPRVHRTHERRGARQLSSIVGILSIMLFFAAVAAALVYEAVGVRVSQARAAQPANVQQLEPITHYVRCAIFYDKDGSWHNIGVASIFAIALTCFLVGYWLWPVQLKRPVAPDGESQERPGLPLAWAALLTLAIGVAFVWSVQYFLNTWIDGTPVATQSGGSVQVTGASFRDGIRAVISFAFGAFFCIATLDFVFAFNRWTPIASRMQDWARANPWFVFFLLVIIGALMAHFIGNAIHYPTFDGSGGITLATFLTSDALATILFAAVTIAGVLAVKASGPLTLPGVSLGIVSFELAGSGRRAIEILDSWRTAEKLAAARSALKWDFGFIASYVVVLVLASVLASRWLVSQADSSVAGAVAATGAVFVGITLVAAACDVVEDFALLRILSKHGANGATTERQIDGHARVAWWSATTKFALLAVVLVFVLSSGEIALGHTWG